MINFLFVSILCQILWARLSYYHSPLSRLPANLVD